MSYTNRRKRQYQPSISSFFTPTPHDVTCAVGTPSRPSVPILPDTVQSSLLNVGMRIRKAVPEGYKTKKMFEESTYQSQSNIHGRHLATIGNNSAGRTTELVPFCGIMKVGGHDFQDIQESSYDAGYTSNFHDETLPVVAFASHEGDDSSFPSSQESTISSISTDSTPASLPVHLPTRDKKRAFDEHNDDNVDEELSNLEAEISRSAATQYDLPSRPLANRWRRRSNRLRSRFVTSRYTATSISELDFGEADFLKFGEDDGEKMQLDSL